jgi:exodeoxyribonuclease VII large subunit
VVTSPTGAVWLDIQTVIGRRYPLVELLLAPAPVQGEAAGAAIVEAFQMLNEEADLDVIILARGGGSLEDLWPFNEEAVARAVYSSRAPVITGVGHETDFTIVDMVADRRAPTPSVAAEMAVPDRSELATRLLVAEQALTSSISGRLSIKSDSFQRLELILQRNRPDLDTLRMRIDDLLQSAATHLTHNLKLSTERLEGLRLRLDSLSPRDTLRRGYAVVQRREDEAVVSDAVQVDTGDELRITLSRGAFDAEVTSTRSDGSGREETPALEPRPNAD